MEQIITALKSAEDKLAEVEKALAALQLQKTTAILDRIGALGLRVTACSQAVWDKKRELYDSLLSATQSILYLDRAVSSGILDGCRIRLCKDFIELNYPNEKEIFMDPRVLMGVDNEALFWRFCRTCIVGIEHYVKEEALSRTAAVKARLDSLVKLLEEIRKLERSFRQLVA